LLPVLLFLLLFLIDKPSFRYKNIGQLFILSALSITAGLIVRDHAIDYQSTERYALIKLLFPNKEIARKYQKEIRELYPDNLPSEFLSQAKNKTVDIFPHHIAVLYAYDLNWSPRPVFQSYSAYTPLLDQMNASHFEKNNAPDNIVYSYLSVDNRYLLFDEPAVFRTLLKNYEVQSLDDYLILQRQSEKINYDSIPIVSGVCPVGTLIDVPQCPGQHVFCNINISTSLWGKLINILYKPPHMYIEFYVKGQSEPITYRFIRRLGVDGLFISKYAVDLSDICSIFEGNYEQDIEKIRISHNFSYKKDMEYEFYAVSMDKK
jgi:hypothetical protein